MLTFYGSKGRFCDGVSRRSFLKLGGLAMGGMALPQILQAEAHAARVGASRHKSVIMVYLSGGISHQDTVDLKPNAPKEIRGEFTPIDTVVPGIQIGNLLPMLAKCTDKMAILRSIVGLRDEHSSWQNVTGHSMDLAIRLKTPHFGSVIARAQGAVDPVVPPFVDLFPTMQHKPYNAAGPGVLGSKFAASKMDSDDLALLRQTTVSADRFEGRKGLLRGFEEFRRGLDSNSVASMDAFYGRAFDVLTSSKVADAMDLSKEDPRIRDRYGKGGSNHLGDGAPMWNDQLLMARRLVEAGARCVTVAYGFWDTHGNNFGHLKQHLPLFDQGISALIEDIYMRGLDEDVTVVVWGEFGRSPKINKDAGRDHWAPVNSAILAGGGMKVGQVIGSTDPTGGRAATHPVHYLDVLATVYHNLGIDPHGFVPDVTGRPIPVMPVRGMPIEKLV